MPRWLQRSFHWISLGDRSYSFLFEGGPPGEVIALDCETTGLNPRSDHIVAIAAVRIEGNRLLTSERFEALVRPDSPPTAGSIKIHQLRAADVEHGQPMYKIIPDLLHFIGGRPLVGYYIDFDVRMLNKYVFPYLEASLPNVRIDISELYFALKYAVARQETGFDLSFASILSDLKIPLVGQHDALSDVVMTGMAYLQLQDLKRRGAHLASQNARIGGVFPIGA